MQKIKFTLPNGVESYIIKAEEGMVLVRNDGLRCGKTQSLGLKYRDKDGNVLPEPVYEYPEDYTEDKMTAEEIEMENSNQILENNDGSAA